MDERLSFPYATPPPELSPTVALAGVLAGFLGDVARGGDGPLALAAPVLELQAGTKRARLRLVTFGLDFALAPTTGVAELETAQAHERRRRMTANTAVATLAMVVYAALGALLVVDGVRRRGVSAQNVIATLAVITYVAVDALLTFLDSTSPQRFTLVYYLVVNIGVGVLVGRWWAVLLVGVPMVTPFLPGTPDPAEGPYVAFAAIFGTVFAALVALGVAGRKLAARIVR